ncbi:Uncharacterised protein [[Clostridium] sordellii]|nr:Uncharacterised protein [[Clostridium] sordellii] [Paeniclostridium sordellii]CEP50387.1 Uncharacterised protein [[Clostridium] sordellii] [Paeniclostridium sordellii]
MDKKDINAQDLKNIIGRKNLKLILNYLLKMKTQK